MTALLLAVAVGTPIDGVMRRKAAVSARVDGVRMRWHGRQVRLSTDASGFIVAATNGRGTRTIGLACPIPLAGRPLPLITICSGNYAERGRRGTRYWFAPSGVEVVVDAFDGGIVAGRFRGALPALAFHGDGTTITVRGDFRGPVR